MSGDRKLNKTKEDGPEAVDHSKRRLVKTAYVAPAFLVLGSVSIHALVGSNSGTGPESFEPVDSLEGSEKDCGQWLNPDCID